LAKTPATKDSLCSSITGSRSQSVVNITAELHGHAADDAICFLTMVMTVTRHVAAITT
jgi:hypothetical protein